MERPDDPDPALPQGTAIVGVTSRSARPSSSARTYRCLPISDSDSGEGRFAFVVWQPAAFTLTGIAAVDRDFLHALFGSFPYVVALVLLLTLILLARAFRSVVLAIKAVVLNVLSLAAAFGIVVFVFQQGHGSSLWGIEATQSITAYIPAMIFAFLYGLSMDYEVFMLSRMREAYDETGSPTRRSSSDSQGPASSSRAAP